jgi:hypothetical membrane protein
VLYFFRLAVDKLVQVGVELLIISNLILKLVEVSDLGLDKGMAVNKVIFVISFNKLLALGSGRLIEVGLLDLIL